MAQSSKVSAMGAACVGVAEREQCCKVMHLHLPFATQELVVIGKLSLAQAQVALQETLNIPPSIQVGTSTPTSLRNQ